MLGATELPTSGLAVSSAPLSAPDEEAPEGERKIVTALFADLKGSTQLMENLDPEVAHAIVAPALRIMAEVVHRYEGYVARSTGDGIFALFGAPAAYEDHPQRALYAALEMQRELRADGQRRTAKGLQSLEARVGVHTGEVVAYSVETSGKVEYRLVGHTANLASRLESMAPVGSIVTSDYTRQLCEGYFEFRALGPMTVKGLSGPVEVYELIGLGSLRSHFQVAARRGLTRFVGRERELEQMRRALELAMSGHGQVVAVMAEAGTGKSRLFYEFKATIPPTCKVLEAYSVSHGKAAVWLPVLDLLRSYFGVADVDDAASRRAKVRDRVTAVDPALEDALPYLFGLLGIVEGPDPIAQMDPTVKRQRTLDAIKRIVVRDSLKQPVVVVFEDLHWIDAQTQALLDLLANSVANSRVLLLCNYRPEYRHEWTNKSYYAQFRLDPLGSAEGCAMLAALLGETAELNPLKQLIAERTGGNPFFIEEIVQALFDEGALTRNGQVKVARSLSQLRLPATVQGILAARIDRLPPEQKELLQTLAVLGRESSRRLLGRVASHPDDRLERILADLQAGEFIYEQPAAGDTTHVFKHALTQEVAYNSLLIKRRKRSHERAGQTIEALFADQLEDHLSQLAHHYSHSDNTDKAVEYLGRAGRQAIQRSAHADAIVKLRSAIDLSDMLPDGPERIQQKLKLQMALGGALMSIKGQGSPEAGKAYAQALELSRQLGETPQLFTILGALSVFHLASGDSRRARELVEQLLRLAENLRTPALLQAAHYGNGVVLFSLGALPQSRTHLERAITLYDRRKQRFPAFLDPGVGSLNVAALVLWSLGYPDQALKSIRESLTLAQDLTHPYSQADALARAAELHYLRREVEATKAQAEAAIALSHEQGFALHEAIAVAYRGWALAKQGQKEEGTAQIRQGLAATEATGAELWQPNLLALLAEACGEASYLDQALTALAEAFDRASRIGRAVSGPGLYQLKGELLLMQNDCNVEEAETCFRRAIEIALSQSAKSWELRAATSLARLLAKQERREEVRAILAGIYSWFTEGFDTADLKDARALLDELRGAPC